MCVCVYEYVNTMTFYKREEKCLGPHVKALFSTRGVGMSLLRDPVYKGVRTLTLAQYLVLAGELRDIGVKFSSVVV